MIKPNRLECGKSWHPYFRHIADMMGLSHWEVWIDMVPAESNATLSICTWTTRCGCTIRLGHTFFDESPEEQLHSVVHEFVHCLLAAHDKVVIEMVTDERLLDTWSVVSEYAVDAIATAITKNYPTPGQFEKQLQKAELRVAAAKKSKKK